MIGNDNLGKLRLCGVDITLMSAWPLWSYTENFMMIQQDLAEICEFQSKCLTGRVESRVESRET